MPCDCHSKPSLPCPEHSAPALIGEPALGGRLVDDEMPPTPGGAAEVWHCGVRMAHQFTAMR
jgi:hypothetical protein